MKIKQYSQICNIFAVGKIKFLYIIAELCNCDERSVGDRLAASQGELLQETSAPSPYLLHYYALHTQLIIVSK